MEESSTYQFIVRRGRILEARHTLLRQGKNKFGPLSDVSTQSQIESITDLERLEPLTDRIPFVTSWEELLAGA